MAAVAADLDTDAGPPVALPLRHFLVAGGFLLLGALAGVLHVAGHLPGRAGLAHVHLLLVGWVVVTIMGAMTQFVPVWSNTALYSLRLATVALWLVAGGVLLLAGSLLAGRPGVAPLGGAAMVAGVWAFAANLGLTLGRLESRDGTERLFAFALACLVVATGLGLVLAVGLTRPVFAGVPVTRVEVLGAHATLAVFGGVLATVVGALAQLGPMFTQTDGGRTEAALRRVADAGYPVGVLGLAAGRLAASAPLARAGGVLIAAGLLAAALALARQLAATRVPPRPMHRRYAVAAAATVAWAALALPAWLRGPLDPSVRFGAAGTGHLLALGVVGLVVFGTLYHVVPFLVWVERYSDRLGREPVPMVDDLYDRRLAAADLVCLAGGGAALVAADAELVPAVAGAAGGVAVLLGAALAGGNLLAVVRRHGSPALVAGLGHRTVAATDDAPGDG